MQGYLAAFGIDVSPWQVKVHDQQGFDEVWSSYGSGSQYRASIWRCSRSESFISKAGFREKVFLGHFASDKLQAPKEQPTQRLEIADIRCGGLMGPNFSDFLPDVLATYVPMPIKFRKAWSQKQGALLTSLLYQRGRACALRYCCHCCAGTKALYAWIAVPPSEDFIALGMVVSESEEPPALSEIRCLPRNWTKPSTFTPKLLWKDAGMGGQKGSIWQINAMGQIHICSGHDAPAGPFFEIVSAKFVVSSLSVLTTARVCLLRPSSRCNVSLR